MDIVMYNTVDAALEWAFVLIIVIASIFAVFKIEDAYQNRKARKRVFEGPFISRSDFEKNWICNEKDANGKTVKKGYKYTSSNGCYVIFVYHQPAEKCGYRNYDDVYVGQSLDINHRVHAHFRCMGNDSVASAIQRGKFLYVRLLPCIARDMNKCEKRYIKALNAIYSYNRTRGGGQRRY